MSGTGVRGGGRRGRHAALPAFLVLTLTAAVAACGGQGKKRFEYAEGHMGTEVRLVLYAADRDAADAAAAEAFLTAARLDSLFSDYRADSGVAELADAAGHGTTLPVAPELWDVLYAGREWARRTGGAFDVALGPLTRLWREAIRSGSLPDSAGVAQALAASGYDGLILEDGSRRVRLERPGMSLDLGGIAKGYVAQTLLAGLSARGIASALVDAGGDIALGDAPPGRDGWRVEFPGGEVHRLARAAVATSGDRYQYLEADGVRYSHILDPRTGLGIPASPTVAVVAPDATTADVLASALTVLGAEAGRALVAGLDGVAARVTHRTGEGISWETEGFPVPPPRPAR